MVDGDFQPLLKRKITEDSCRKFGYRLGKNSRGQTVQVAEYRDEDGTVVAQHIRGADKEFSWAGDAKAVGLWGKHLWRDKGTRVIVTEGEIDAMSLAQVFNLRWPVVSVPNGAQSAKKALQRDLEWLEGYDTIVLAFDMDEPGRQAVAECAPLFTPGKCKVLELPRKDANAMLQEDMVKELIGAVYEARTYRPDGIVTLEEIEGRVLADMAVGRPWFDDRLTAATFGRRLGEVYMFGAGTGVGKTDLFTQQIAYDIFELGETCGVLYLEQGVPETARRIAGKRAGRRFHVPDGSWSRAELEAAWGALKATGRLHLYDNWGAMDWATIKSKIRFMVLSLGCRHIYLDHLTALAAAEEDERRALEQIMAEAAGMANSLGFCLHMVSHLATPDGTPHEEGGRVMIRHFKGSRAIGFWSHGMFGLERDQQHKDVLQRAVTTIRCLKDRHTGQATGKTFPLRYDTETGLLTPVEEDGIGDGGGFTDETKGDF